MDILKFTEKCGLLVPGGPEYKGRKYHYRWLSTVEDNNQNTKTPVESPWQSVNNVQQRGTFNKTLLWEQMLAVPVEQVIFVQQRLVLNLLALDRNWTTTAAMANLGSY